MELSFYCSFVFLWYSRERKTKFMKISFDITKEFIGEGFRSRTYISAEDKIGAEIGLISVFGSYPRQKVVEGTTKSYFIISVDKGQFIIDGNMYQVSARDVYIIEPGQEYEFNGIMRLLEINISPDNSFKSLIL
jgi:hypothetical protein